MQTLDWLAHRARISARQVALIQGERQWSYLELDQAVAGYAARLAAAGVKAGQRVAVLMPNRFEYVCLIHALARMGAVLVPLNIRLAEPELRWQLQQADCAFLLCSGEVAGVAAALQELPVRVLNVDKPQVAGLPSLAEFSAEAINHWQSRPLNLEASQGIVFTSGTTGQAKGATLSYGNHLWSATASAFRLGTGPADRWLLCMPLYHVGGLAIVLRCCLYGTTVVLQPGFEPAAVARALETQAVTLLSLVPTMLHRLLASQSESLVTSPLRCLLLGGAATPPTLLAQCLALKLPVAPSYGLTEAASQVATASPAEVRQNPQGGVGKPLMFTSVRIVDEAGQPCAPGEIGEILVSGPTVMAGYYNQPEATHQRLHNNEFRTGDMGYLDTEGNLSVVQRRADLILSGGENVYPVEVEQVLKQHPAVEDACVVGLEDAEWGQRVAAAIILKPDFSPREEEILTFSRQRLAGYKQPRLIRFVAALPQTASGKVIREKVKELLH
jgi:o-succinylbenzoate---CoA ligase